MPSAVSVQHLTKMYGSLTAVDDFSLEVPPGIIFGLLGPNAAGKTTLLKMLTTLATPTAGDAYIEGFSIRTASRRVRELIGVVPQENNLDRYLTARENLTLHARMHGLHHRDYNRRIDDLLDLVGLTPRQHDYPDTFSGGMQRRLVAARALVHSPRVLFLDELTTGLDPQSRRALWDYIRSLKATMTIFLTTHYMDEADALCDRIMIMDEGRSIADGTSEELKDALARSHIYEIELREEAEKMAALMSGLPFVESLKREGNTFQLTLREETDMKPLIEAIGAGSLRKIRLVEPTLEDVFIELTGKRIRD